MKNITISRINKKVVRPIVLPPELQGKIVKGRDIYFDPFFNAFICAKKKSGKTTVLAYMLDEIVGPETTVIFFVSSLYRDATYKQILKRLKDKGIHVVKYTSFVEGGVNQLDAFINHLESLEEESDEEYEDKPNLKLRSNIVTLNDADDDDEDTEEASKKRWIKSKLIYPRYVIVIDDMGKRIRNDAVGRLMRVGRHHGCSCITVSQVVKGCHPDALKNCDLFLIFQKIPIDKLKHIWQEADLSLPFDVFYKLYRITTRKKYKFLYIDTQNDTYRKDFDLKYNIPEIDFLSKGYIKNAS